MELLQEPRTRNIHTEKIGISMWGTTTESEAAPQPVNYYVSRGSRFGDLAEQVLFSGSASLFEENRHHYLVGRLLNVTRNDSFFSLELDGPSV